MQVYPLGSIVEFGLTDVPIKGKVFEILIKPSEHIMYHVRWYIQGACYTEWLEEFEVTLFNDAELITIGFK